MGAISGLGAGVMSAAAIAVSLGGRQSRNGWWSCQCPVCQGEGKLGLKDGSDGLAVNCFHGCSYSEILSELESLGLYDPESAEPARELTEEELQHQIEVEARKRAQRIADARDIWNETRPAGSIVQVYLWNRSLFFPLPPDRIRFHPGSRRRGWGPAMVCRVDHAEHDSVGVHFTFLTPAGQKISIKPQRKTYGPVGGGAIQIGEPQPDNWTVVGEGLESTLSIALAINAPGWAALSAPGIKSLALPPAAKMVLIAADNDGKGVGQRAAEHAARRWVAEGRKVRIILPPMPNSDWNDVVCGKAPGSIEGF